MRITVDCGRINILPSAGLTRISHSLTRIHQELGQEYQLLVQRGFEAERSPADRPWQALSPATVRRRGSAHPILRLSGRLARTHLRADATCAVVGSNLVYAAIHQYGGEIRRQGGEVKLHFRKFQRGPRRGRTLFSKESNASYGMKAAVGPYSIRIPARPWLFNADGTVPGVWAQRLTAIVGRYLEEDV